MLQILWKIERFQLQNVAKTVEMAASSSKMLHIARKTGRNTDQNIPKRKSQSQNIMDPLQSGSTGYFFARAGGAAGSSEVMDLSRRQNTAWQLKPS